MPRPFFSHFYHFPVSEISDRFLIWCLLCLATTNQINWRPWTVIEGYWKFGLHWSFDDKCIWEYKINLWTFSLWTKVTKAVNIKHVYLKCKIWSVPKQYIVFSPLQCFPHFHPYEKPILLPPCWWVFSGARSPLFSPIFSTQSNSLLINVSRCRSVPKQDRRGSRRRSSPCSTMHPLLLLLHAVRLWTSR